MRFTRRSFIGKLGVSALAAVSIGSIGNVFGQTSQINDLFLPPPESMSDPVNYLTSRHFEPFVNTSFKIQTGERNSSRLILKEVKNLARKDMEKLGYSGESFSLLFKGSKRIKLAPDSYQFEHDALGKFSFLLIPVGISGASYEVIVNRIGR